jgi:hypothetical protein
MKTLERINSTLVRHDWPKVEAGVAQGKTFVVESHKEAVARIGPPDEWDKAGNSFDLDAHFKALRSSKPVPLAKAEPTRSPE